MTDCQMEGCYRDAEFSVKLGAVWGQYCEKHMVEAARSEYDTRVVLGTPPEEA